MKNTLFLLLGLIFLFKAGAQQNKLSFLVKQHDTNIRGLSIFASKTIWVSGSKGQIGKSLDGGRTWKWYSPKGFETRDFRDIQALGATTALVIAIDTPALILKTTDGGESWQTVYQNNTKGMFLDAMDFSDPARGMVVGDPIDGKIFLAGTADSGDHWTPLPSPAHPSIENGEAFFAASGSNIFLNKDGSFYLASGGYKSRLWTPVRAVTIPTMMQGATTAGANGLDVNGSMIAVAGGDFSAPDRSDSCLALSDDGGKTWYKSGKTPGGYISGIRRISKDRLVICGLNGAWVSADNGGNWQQISEQAFNTVSYDKNSTTCYFAGPNGAVAAYYFQ